MPRLVRIILFVLLLAGSTWGCADAYSHYLHRYSRDYDSGYEYRGYSRGYSQYTVPPYYSRRNQVWSRNYHHHDEDD